MSKIKSALCAVAISISTGASAQGIPVIDVANVTQAIQQVIAWGQQYQQMVNQLQQMQSQLNSLTGSRGLGTVANLVGINDLVPANIQSAIQGAQDLQSLIGQIKNITSSGATSAVARAQQVQQLMALINGTTDPKGVAEIQARIQAENAAILNDTNRLILMDMQQRAATQKLNEDMKAATANNLRNGIVLTPTFTGAFRLEQQ